MDLGAAVMSGQFQAGWDQQAFSRAGPRHADSRYRCGAALDAATAGVCRPNIGTFALPPADTRGRRGPGGSHPRAGRLNSLWMLLLSAGGTIAVLIGLLMQGGPGEAPPEQRLSMYCAAGLRPPVERIARMYREEYGITVDLQYGGSNTLLNQIEVNKFDTADLYLAADGSYTEQAVAQGLAAEVLPIAHMQPVLAVRRGNPKRIESLQDLLREDVSVALADPEQAAAGRAAKERLEKVPAGHTNAWVQLEQHVTRFGVFKPTVNDVATDVKIGAVDAGIVWDNTVAMPKYRDDLEVADLAELAGEPLLVSVAVLNSSRQPAAALRFARYLTARDRGLPVFAEAGLKPVDGDAWALRPEITFFCGAINRRALEPILREFSEREAVVVDTIYDGCGILTGRMRAIAGQRTEFGFPDVYMACDVYYLENVKQWFQEAANVSAAEIVIAVPKGSDRVKSLADLVRPGIRVAVGQPEQCTIGALTRRLLVSEGLYEQLRDKQRREGEVVVEKSSSALLVPDVVAGHVDAAVAYITDVLANQDTVDIVRISSPLNVAVQPFGIARTSRHKYLVRRLFQRITRSPEVFTSAGFEFRWRDGSAATEGGSP